MGPNVILTKEDLDEAVAYFLTKDAFAFDVETMGENRGEPSENEVVWLALSTYGRTIVIPMGHPNGNVLLRKEHRKKNKITGKFEFFPNLYDDPPNQLPPSVVFDALRPLFFSDRLKIAQNTTFDACSVIKYFGERPPGPYTDIILIQHLLNENHRNRKLKAQIERFYKVKYDFEDTGKCIEKHSFKKVAHYAFMDAKYTFFIWRLLEPALYKDGGQDEVYEMECDLIPVLCDMRHEGAFVDWEELLRLEKELSEQEVVILGDVYRAAGRKFNMNSTPQKCQILYGLKKDGGQGLKPRVPTDGGKKKLDRGEPLTIKDYSTSAEVLEEYYPNNPLVKHMIAYAEVHKLLSTYVRAYIGVEKNVEAGLNKDRPCRVFDDRVHTDLVQYGTVTGRFSSREPNLQNIPRPDTPLGKKIRGLFKAPEGHKLVVADYGQIEMILLAHFADPGRLFEGIWNGMDPHSATAAALQDIPTEEFMRMVAEGDEIAKALRQVAKGINFAVVYGAGAEKVASMAGITVAKAKKFLKIHQQMFPEIYEFKEEVLKVARSRRPPHIRTLLGRKRRLPMLFSKDNGSRGYAERQAVNSLIQGSAADIIKLAMIRLHGMLEDDMKLILSVHDELVVLCPEESADRCAGLVHEAMLGKELQDMISVPLSADVKIVNRWSEAK